MDKGRSRFSVNTLLCGWVCYIIFKHSKVCFSIVNFNYVTRTHQGHSVGDILFSNLTKGTLLHQEASGFALNLCIR